MEILQSWLPWHSDADIFDVWFFYAFLFSFSFWVKKSKPVRATRIMYSQTGENTTWANTFIWCLLLIFKVVYWNRLTQSLPFAWEFLAKRQWLVWGQVGSSITPFGTFKASNEHKEGLTLLSSLCDKHRKAEVWYKDFLSFLFTTLSLSLSVPPPPPTLFWEAHKHKLHSSNISALEQWMQGMHTSINSAVAR